MKRKKIKLRILVILLIITSILSLPVKCLANDEKNVFTKEVILEEGEVFIVPISSRVLNGSARTSYFFYSDIFTLSAGNKVSVDILSLSGTGLKISLKQDMTSWELGSAIVGGIGRYTLYTSMSGIYFIEFRSIYNYSISFSYKIVIN